jgi:hypothetical protein
MRQSFYHVRYYCNIHIGNWKDSHKNHMFYLILTFGLKSVCINIQSTEVSLLGNSCITKLWRNPTRKRQGFWRLTFYVEQKRTPTGNRIPNDRCGFQYARVRFLFLNAGSEILHYHKTGVASEFRNLWQLVHKGDNLQSCYEKYIKYKHQAVFE